MKRIYYLLIQVFIDIVFIILLLFYSKVSIYWLISIVSLLLIYNTIAFIFAFKERAKDNNEKEKWINYNDVIYRKEYYLGIESGLTPEEADLNAKSKLK